MAKPIQYCNQPPIKINKFIFKKKAWEEERIAGCKKGSGARKEKYQRPYEFYLKYTLMGINVLGW